MIVKRIFVMLVMTATVAFSNAQQGPGGFYKIPSRQSVITTPLPAEQLVLQTDSVRWLKLTRMVMAGWKLDTVYKEGWYTIPEGPEGDFFWETSGTTLKKKDSTLSTIIQQFKGGAFSSLEMDEEKAILIVEDMSARLPEDSLINDSTSKADYYLRQNIETTGLLAGLFMSNSLGKSQSFLNKNGNLTSFGLDASFPGALTGESAENVNGKVNLGVKSKPIGIAYFTQIAASTTSNPPYPTYPSATIDGRTGGGTAVLGAAGYQGTGVYGYQSGNYGQGIWGYSDVSYAVRANTVSGKALYAMASGSGTAVYGLSESGLQFQFGYDKATPDDSTMVMLKSGHVGIGTTIPSTKLEVNGVITAMGGNSTYWNSAYSWGNHSGLYAPASTVSSQWESVTDFEGHYGIATDSNNVILKQGSLILGNYEPGQAQSIKFTGTGTDAFKIENTSDDDDLLRIYADDEKGIFLNQSSGHVGVGTTTMSEALTVNGNIHAQNIRYTAISENDHYGSGDIITLTASATMGIGDVVFVNSNGKTALCKADAIENCPYAFAICVSGSIGANEAGSFLTKGSLRDDSWNWTVGGLIFVSTTGTTGNTLTQTIPSGANNVIMPIGLALSADALYFFGNVNSVEKQ